MDKLYLPTPDGYCGDEDNGQTSAWYVFSSLGFYPVSPGSGEYVIGSPQFDKVKLRLENGKEVLIQAKQQESNQVYIDQLSWDGKPYGKNYIRYKDLMQGANLEFKMSDTPNKSRGTKKEDAPYSFSNEKIKGN